MSFRAASLALVVIVSALGASSARAQSLTADPTLIFSTTADGQNGPIYEGGLYLGAVGRTPEFGPGLTLEADLSVLAIERSYTRGVILGSGPGTVAGGVAAQSQVERVSKFNLSDNSSFVTLGWRPRGWKPGNGLTLTVMPLHSDRIYLGYAFPAVRMLLPDPMTSGLTPGARVQLQHATWYAFAAAKTAQEGPSRFGNAVTEARRTLSLLAGGGVDLAQAVKLEAEGSHAFGSKDPFVSLDTWGAAARVLVHKGEVIGAPTDFARYAADPSRFESLLQPPRYGDDLAATVSAEAVYLSLSGVQAQYQPTADSSESGEVYALEGRAQWRATRAYLRAQLRSYAAVAAPSPFDPPASDGRSPELSVTATVDHHFARLGLTPGASFELVRPASERVQIFESSPYPQQAVPGTEVVGPSGAGELSADDTVRPLLVAQLTLRWDFHWLSVVGAASLQHDANVAARPARTDSLFFEPEVSPDTYAFDLFAQARF